MLLIRPEEWWRLRAWQWEKQRRNDRMTARHRQRGFIINPFAFATGGGGDPYFANVVSLAHFNGTNGQASPFDDVVRGAGAWTENGASATLSTATKQFGTASLQCGAVGVYNADHADWNFGSGDFTCEGWFYRNDATTAVIAGQWNSASGNLAPWLVYVTNTGTITFGATTTTAGWDWLQASSAGILPTATWFYFAICRSGSTIRGFLDGTEIVTSGTLSGAVVNNADNVTLGNTANGGLGFNGYIDEFRATKGVARYTSGFTPPAAEFPDS